MDSRVTQQRRDVGVSRAWSGKTLSEHRADRASVVRQVLSEAGIEAPDVDRMAADVLDKDGLPRFVWEDVPVTELDYVRVVLASVREAHRWRQEYEPAKQRVAAPGESECRPRDPVEAPVRQPLSPRPPDSQPIQVA